MGERKQKQKPGCKKHRGKAQTLCDRIADAGFKKCAKLLDGLRFKKVKNKSTYMIHHLGLKLGLGKKAKKIAKKTEKKTAKVSVKKTSVRDLVEDGMSLRRTDSTFIET